MKIKKDFSGGICPMRATPDYSIDINVTLTYTLRNYFKRTFFVKVWFTHKFHTKSRSIIILDLGRLVSILFSLF